MSKVQIFKGTKKGNRELRQRYPFYSKNSFG